MKTYRDWPLLDSMPAGWVRDNTGSPLAGYVFITNGKSVIAGQKRALLLVRERQSSLFFSEAPTPTLCRAAEPKTTKPKVKQTEQEASETARTVNDLARARLKQKLLADILVDLTICEIEGWSKREYIMSLQDLINGIEIGDALVTSNTNSGTHTVG